MAPKSENRRGIAVLPEIKAEKPRMYRVFLHNDDYTTMDFVVGVLMEVFNKQMDEAVRIMFAVHQQGLGECGAYTAEIAETKIDRVHSLARAADFPLRCSMEPE